MSASEASAAKAASEEKAPVLVRARNVGQVSSVIEILSRAYLESHDGMALRWVYHPEGRPEVSKILERRAQGYRPVKVGELELDDLLEDRDEDEVVRVADLILMAIPAEKKAALQKENDLLAKEQRSQVQEEYYHKVMEMAQNLGQEHAPRARGRSVIAERDFSYEVEQRGGES